MHGAAAYKGVDCLPGLALMAAHSCVLFYFTAGVCFFISWAKKKRGIHLRLRYFYLFCLQYLILLVINGWFHLNVGYTFRSFCLVLVAGSRLYVIHICLESRAGNNIMQLSIVG